MTHTDEGNVIVGMFWGLLMEAAVGMAVCVFIVWLLS